MTGRRLSERPWSVASLLAGLTLLVGGAAGSPSIAICGPFVSAFGVAEWERRRRRAADRRARDRLSSAVDHLIQQLRAGLSIRQSCEGLEREGHGSDVPALTLLAVELRAGQTLAGAANRLRDHQDGSIRLLAVTLEVLADNGGPAVPALQRLRLTLIGAAQARQQAETEAAQSLASAGLMACAPAVFAVAVAALEPAAGHLYLYEVTGAVCLSVALALSAGGWWWMQRLLDRSVRAAVDPGRRVTNR